MMTQNGILLIDKPEGPSSAQVVHRVKTILGAKKVGHLGTLDPFASGLLLIGVNEGTKIADIFLGGAKSYRGVMCLGIETILKTALEKFSRPTPWRRSARPSWRCSNASLAVNCSKSHRCSRH